MPTNEFLKILKHRKSKHYLLLFFLPLIAACSAVTVREDGSIVRRYFGYVRVITPPSASNSGKFQAMEYTSFGLRMEKGVGFGYYHERNEYIPLDCRVVIRVMNEQQLKEVMNSIKMEGLCVTVDSN
ncbi:MAG: hypothetical protein HYS23_03495 [Geobacter sp.]|nr:hypothetical protein [Geobacter sp.]